MAGVVEAEVGPFREPNVQPGFDDNGIALQLCPESRELVAAAGEEHRCRRVFGKDMPPADHAAQCRYAPTEAELGKCFQSKRGKRGIGRLALEGEGGCAAGLSEVFCPQNDVGQVDERLDRRQPERIAAADFAKCLEGVCLVAT